MARLRGKRPRNRRRQRRPRRNRFRTALGVVSVLVVSGFLYVFHHYLQSSPQFQVRTVEIDGARYLDDESVLSASGITWADNVFQLDLNAARSEVESMPYVESCSVSITFPDTVVLSVKERQPFATLLVHSHAYEIDREGVVLREYDPGELPKPPFITKVPGLKFVHPGQKPEQPVLRDALAIWDACLDAGVPEEVSVSELAALAPDDIRMFCDSIPYEIRWGRGEYPRQAVRLTAFWDTVGKYAPCRDYLDLRFGRDLACK